MKDIDYSLIAIQIVLIIALISLLIFILKVRKSSVYEKRLDNYSIKPINRNTSSYFEKINYAYLTFRKNITNILKKIKIFDDYCKKYEKYIDKTKIIEEEAMDFISDKFIYGLISVLILLTAKVIQYDSFTSLEIITFFLLGFFAQDIVLSLKNKYLGRRVENDLLKAVIIMNNAFKSGRSTMQAIKLVSEQLDGPISDEFKKMYIDLTFGLTVETVFDRFSKRVNIDETKYITASLTILNKTGGNIVKVFSSIERTFFNNRKMKQELKSMTASAKIIFNILVGLPVILFVLIMLLNPSYFSPLFKSTIGMLLLGVMLLIYISYIVIIRKTMTIKE